MIAQAERAPARRSLQDLLEADLVVRNPAIPPSVGWIQRIREAGVPQTSEVALALQDLRVPYAIVTGSKGKTTTATLAGSMLAQGRVAGNNERALSEVVDTLAPDDRVVLEVSSFMAHLLREGREQGVRFPAPAAVAITSAVLLAGAILGVLALTGDDGVSIFVPPNSARSQDDSVDDFIVKKGRSRSHGHGPSVSLAKLSDDTFQIRAEDDGQNTCSFELTYDDCKKSGMCTWADGVCSESSSLQAKAKLSDDTFQIRAEDDGQNTCSFELTYDDCKKSGMCTWADGVCSESSK